MADEKIGISVEVKGTGAGIKSVKELKNEVQKLEDTASKADFGSDEFKKATEEANKLKGKMTEISGAETTKMNTSLKGLQQEYKKLKVALSEAANPEEFKRLSKELNDVEGKIGDINDAASIATGSGVEQLNKGIGLVGEGFRNFDFEKIKIGFKGIGNAMSAAAPLLLVAAIGALIENFDAVKAVIVQIIPALDSTSKATHDLEKEQKRLVETNKLAVVALENELLILEASGASQSDILAKKKELIAVKIKELESDNALQKSRLVDIQQNDTLLEGTSKLYALYLRKTGQDALADFYDKTRMLNKLEREKEFNDKIKENEIAISRLKTELVVAEIKDEKDKYAAYLKALEDKKKQAEIDKKQSEIDGDARYQAWKDEQQRMADEEAVIIPEQKQAIAKTELEINAEKNAELLNQSALQYEADKKLAEEAAKQKAKSLMALEKASFDAAKGLSDAIFSIQIGNAKKGSAEELKLKKQQFNVNKAFSVTQATIDGVKAVQGVLAQSAFYGPFTVPIAIATGVSAAANVAKIASAKFDGGNASGGASGGGAAPQIGSTSLPTPPTINTPNNNTSTMFDEQGNNLGLANDQRTAQPIKVFVTETDISEIQNRANKLKTQTTI